MSRLSDKFNLNKGKYNRQKIKLQSRFKGLLGFKFQFKGRFTRKLIAASYKYSIGRMPLTTLNADIDYAFKTVAIKNSAVGVKV
jgi:ribosomal protein S3